LRELYTHNGSAIHQIDARVKVIFTLAFVLSLSLTPFRAWPAYILFLTLILSVTLLSRLGIRFVFKRAFLALPFVLAALPLIFTGPSPYGVISIFQGVQITYSPEGCERFASIAIKSWISVQAAILLAATTRFPDLLIAFKQLKVPVLFVTIIGLMWRYLFVISEEVARMMRARASRSTTALSQHTGGTLFWRARVTGGMAGSLFLRSLERSDRVYAAMLSRGYTGELPPSETSILSRKNRQILILGICLLVLLWLLGLLTGG
jgi:cobalt/nickel transport system permease protein